MRITARQLRQIIKEEVEKMMNEAELEVTTPSQLVDAVTSIENMIADEAGVALGAAASVFVDIYKGRRPQDAKQAASVDAAKKILFAPEVDETGFASVHQGIRVCRAIVAANGKSNIQITQAPINAVQYVAVNGVRLDEDVITTSMRIISFLRNA